VIKNDTEIVSVPCSLMALEGVADRAGTGMALQTFCQLLNIRMLVSLLKLWDFVLEIRIVVDSEPSNFPFAYILHLNKFKIEPSACLVMAQVKRKEQVNME